MPDPIPLSASPLWVSDPVQVAFGFVVVFLLSWFLVLFLLAVADAGRAVGEARRERRTHGLG